MSIFRRNKSLKSHLWFYFCTFAVIIMLILWVLQIFFMNTFFNSMKLNELEKTGSEIANHYELNKDDFYKYWFEHSYKFGIFAHIISENGDITRNYNTTPKFQEDAGKPPRVENRGFVDRVMFENFITKMKNASSNEVSYIEKNRENRDAFAVYGAYLGKLDGEKMYLFLSSPLERTDTTRKVLQTQLITVTVISVFLALILAYFIAKRLSKPIENITETSHELAKGNYDVNFEHASYLEINELADALNYTATELSKTENLRRDLISNVSHDLRTPLTIIKSYAEMIRDLSGNNEEKRNKHTGVIIDETNRLSLLVNDMLDLSKAQSGTMEMEVKPFDISKTVKAILGRFSVYAENEGYIFEFKNNSSLIALGDEKRIEQVIYNLIGNAVNFTGEDKKVFVSVEERDEKIAFSVRDTGKGIPKDELERVWDKYYKSSATHRKRAVGTGIGLSIVKNILIAHNARYGVESEINKGTEFWFELNKSFKSKL